MSSVAVAIMMHVGRLSAGLPARERQADRHGLRAKRLSSGSGRFPGPQLPGHVMDVLLTPSIEPEARKFSVDALSEILGDQRKNRYRVRAGGPIRIEHFNEPRPDIVL